MAKKEPNSKSEKEIAGISVISSIVSKVISDPSQILSGLKQILFFYRLLPKEWKKRAFWIFEKLWNKGKVVISTNPEQVEKIYEVKFEDKQLNNLYELLPQVDKAIMLQGKSMIDLINKSLHGDSDEIKINVEERYGKRGLNIVNMITTGDIHYLLEEIGEKQDKSWCEKQFNDWAYYYDNVALLVRPNELTEPSKIKERIVKLSKATPKDYALINLSGKMEDCTNLLNLIVSLKEEDKKLFYKHITHDISDSGFCKSLRVKLVFK